jgi:hypothetical protein
MTASRLGPGVAGTTPAAGVDGARSGAGDPGHLPPEVV